MLPSPQGKDDDLPLHDVLCLDTVENLEANNTRSSFDNNHHPKQFVLLCDWNWYEENLTPINPDLKATDEQSPSHKGDNQQPQEQ